MILQIIGALVVLVGLCIALDSRRLVKKYLNFGEENSAVMGMKIMGFVIIVVGATIMLCA